MNNLGDCYKDGEGVTKDLNKAKEWYIKAAAHGDEDAQEKLDELKFQQEKKERKKRKRERERETLPEHNDALENY